MGYPPNGPTTPSRYDNWRPRRLQRNGTSAYKSSPTDMPGAEPHEVRNRPGGMGGAEGNGHMAPGNQAPTPLPGPQTGGVAPTWESIGLVMGPDGNYIAGPDYTGIPMNNGAGGGPGYSNNYVASDGPGLWQNDVANGSMSWLPERNDPGSAQGNAMMAAYNEMGYFPTDPSVEPPMPYNPFLTPPPVDSAPAAPAAPAPQADPFASASYSGTSYGPSRRRRQGRM